VELCTWAGSKTGKEAAQFHKPSLSEQGKGKYCMANPIPLLKPTSTADRVASILRERIMTTGEGSYIGTEADLAGEIGVSLPTLRQAARMLEHEELLKIKPGKGGGYFTRRPTIETAIKSASQFLSAKDLNYEASFMDAADAIIGVILEHSVQCNDRKLREELRQFIEDQKESSETLVPAEQSMKHSITLMNLFGRMSENILLELFSRILWNEVSVSHTVRNAAESQDLIETNYHTRLYVAEAVLAQDKDKTLQAWQKRSSFLRSWAERGMHITRQRLAS
jgi:GntR family transcriptional regulator, transcriptional repressor for pyruvate dehydrogenase complex